MKHLYQTFQHQQAPDLYGDFWFNSKPLSIRDLEGRPAVLFFWDCCSLQSKRLIPFINGLHALYMEFGLVCIGIHSCEFEFGRSAARVEQEIKENLILFPVLTDNSRVITDAYRIGKLPTIVLIDNKGSIYDMRSGVFIPEQIERSLQFLLRQSGYYGELPLLLNPEYEENYALTEGDIHEIYAGYAHGALGNPEGYSPELPAEYRDPQIYLDEKFYIHGEWKAERDSLVYVGQKEKGFLVCRCTGSDAHVLLGSHSKSRLKITLNDKPVRLSVMGNDVRKDKRGYTFIEADEPRLLSLIQHNQEKENIIKLVPLTSGVSFYMFSFVDQSVDARSANDSSIRNN